MRRFLSKKITLMLIPNSQGVMKQIDLPVVTLYVGVLTLVALLVTTFYLSAGHFTDRVTQFELEQLRAENQHLADKYEQMRVNLAEVEVRYADLVQKEIMVRSVFSLPEINLEERQLGIGGPVSPAIEALSPAEHTALVTEGEIDRLLRLSSFEIEKYNEIEQELTGLKDRLDHTPSIWPCKGWLSRGFGMKDDPFTGYKRMHSGIDIASNRGTEIIAPADGKVVSVRYNGNMGKMITVDHGYGFKTRYGHLLESNVKVGQRVKRGDTIALMGSSGYSTGPHLHYEVIRNGKSINPLNHILNEK
ncbi:MAG: peptidoglycan DD-metalloendopeptidase family protein [bacterium]